MGLFWILRPTVGLLPTENSKCHFWYLTLHVAISGNFPLDLNFPYSNLEPWAGISRYIFYLDCGSDYYMKNSDCRVIIFEPIRGPTF